VAAFWFVCLSHSLPLSLSLSLSVCVNVIERYKEREREGNVMSLKSVSAIIFQGRRERNNLQCKCFQSKKEYSLNFPPFLSVCNKLGFIEGKIVI
jgi:hypothetical protein